MGYWLVDDAARVQRVYLWPDMSERAPFVGPVSHLRSGKIFGFHLRNKTSVKRGKTTPRRTRQQAAPGGGDDRWGPQAYIPLAVAIIGAIGTIVAALITPAPGFSEPVPMRVSESAPDGFFSTRSTGAPAVSSPTETFGPASPSIQGVGCGDNLLPEPWHLEATGRAAESWIDFNPPYKPTDTDGLLITYDLNGLRAREGTGRNDSVIALTQPNWYGVSLAALSTNMNGFDGEQTAYIPLIDFRELPNVLEDIEGNRPLTWGEDVSSIRARFWDFDRFGVDITSIRLCRRR